MSTTGGKSGATPPGVACGVGVVVPCFNAERTLAATLTSALAQEHVAEIVVVDDGSSDASVAIARRFEPRVRVLTGPNRGVSAARNRGIAEATTEWLLFLDSDDLLLPGSVSLRLAVAQASGADVVISEWEEILDDGRGAPSIGAVCRIDWTGLERDAEVAAATTAWAPPAALLYHKSLVERIGGFRTDLRVVEDARFLFDAAYHGARFVPTPHVGAGYRVQPGSSSRRNPGLFWQCLFINGRQIEALWRARGPLDDGRRAALAGIYNNAARGLFAAGHADYFEAVTAQRALGGPLPRHSRVVGPLARVLGMRAARSLASLVGAP